MKLLVLTPQLPFPPNKGTTIRNFNFLRHLGRHYETTLLSFDEGGDRNVVEQLAKHCRSIVLVPEPRRGRVTRFLELAVPSRPDLVRRLWSREMAAKLEEQLRSQRFDLVQIEGLEMAVHWDAVTRDRRLRQLPRAVLDGHNAEYVLQRRAFEIDVRIPGKWPAALYSLIQFRKLRRYERNFSRRIAGVVAASDFDRQAFLELDTGLRVATVPNGVDYEYYQAIGAESRGGQDVLFVGTLDFRPNVDGLLWFCRAIWPLVVAAVPAATFWIVGRNPTSEVARLANGQSIKLASDVPDVRPFLARASIAVAPLRIGGGTRLKVLEAMAAGVPVVGTGLGCEGIAVTPEVAAVADDANSIAANIVELLRDEARRLEQGRAARRFVEQHYDWKVIVPLLERFHWELVG